VSGKGCFLKGQNPRAHKFLVGKPEGRDACETQAKVDIKLDEDIMCDVDELTQLARDSLVSCENDNEYHFTQTAGIFFII
jgi:hypothetical protein